MFHICADGRSGRLVEIRGTRARLRCQLCGRELLTRDLYAAVRQTNETLLRRPTP